MTATRPAAVLFVLLGACSGAERPHRAATPTTTTTVSSASSLSRATEPTPSSAPTSPSVAVGARPGPSTTTTSRSTPTTTAGSTTSTTAALPSTGPRCPDARTCDVYQLMGDKGWRPGADGVARIPVYINPTPPPGSTMTADQLEADILAMMGMWEEAGPNVRFRYLGRTTREPRIGDGYSDLGYGRSVHERRDGDGYIMEADLTRLTGPGDSIASYPCDRHRDGGCGPSGSEKTDTRQLLAHELGHVLGSADLDSDDTVELTMYHGYRPVGDRSRVTLGLGDVLFVRRLYPCGCPLPRIYVP